MPAVELDTERTESHTRSRFAGKRVHFIGIGGCGMSGLASMLLDAGAIVSGSDPKPGAAALALSRRGAKLSRDQQGELLSREVDLVVRTAAVKDNNPEFLAARALGIAHVKYAQLLGQVMRERLGVAVAGTHGKSTTTAMIAFALSECGLAPSFVVGGTVPQLGGGSRSGTGEAFVVEACEFDRSFHNLHPRIAIITNIEADHLDCYGSLDAIIESFAGFAALVPHDGLILANAADPNVRAALAGTTARIQWIALGDIAADWYTSPGGLRNGCPCGEVFRFGQRVGELTLSVAGDHNLFNATVALAACAACGAKLDDAIAALGRFRGVDRRMTEMGTCNGARVIDDYGHHPTEIRVTLRALRQRYNPARLFCVFQPHQYSRTRLLLDEFAGSFADADLTLVPDIYAVRDSEQERRSVSAAELVRRINAAGAAARHMADFDSIIAHLKQTVREGDLVLTIGAGDVWTIGRELVE